MAKLYGLTKNKDRLLLDGPLDLVMVQYLNIISRKKPKFKTLVIYNGNSCHNINLFYEEGDVVAVISRVYGFKYLIFYPAVIKINNGTFYEVTMDAYETFKYDDIDKKITCKECFPESKANKLNLFVDSHNVFSDLYYAILEAKRLNEEISHG
jgi:hypothetical protein